VALDSELAGAVAGDERAFTALYRGLQPSLLRYLRVLAGPTGVSAEDVASEVWAASIPRLGRFSGGEREFRSWLFTIARDKVADRERAQSQRPVHLTDDAGLLDQPDPQDVAQEAIAGMSTDLAMSLLTSLPPEQAEIISLRVLGELDTESVALIVGKSAGAIRVAQHRGLRRLGALLEQARTDAAVTA
jgi:RNA polymerase sigma-70 factor (ECF subfamily)